MDAAGVEIPQALRDEVVRIHGAFVEEFVEDRGWCPFARAARRAATSEVRVLWRAVGPDAPLQQWAPLGDWLDEFASGSLEILQVVCPLIDAPARAWERRTRELLDAYQSGLERSAIAMAAFHPDLEMRFVTGPGIVPLLRRSPFAMIQFVRLDALERVRQGRSGADVFVAPGTPEFYELLNTVPKKPLGKAIVEANFEQVTREGVELVEAALNELAVRARVAVAGSGRRVASW
jgi:hypothetical protein